jgi:hypothetical protein
VLASPPPSGSDVFALDLAVHGTAVTKDAEQFGELLKAFSLRNSGRRVVLEEDDPTVGAQVQASGYHLSGASYDRKDSRVEVMLSVSTSGRAHLTRNIAGVDSIAITSRKDGGDTAMQLKHGKAQTLILFN